MYQTGTTTGTELYLRAIPRRSGNVPNAQGQNAFRERSERVAIIVPVILGGGRGRPKAYFNRPASLGRRRCGMGWSGHFSAQLENLATAAGKQKGLAEKAPAGLTLSDSAALSRSCPSRGPRLASCEASEPGTSRDGRTSSPKRARFSQQSGMRLRRTGSLLVA